MKVLNGAFLLLFSLSATAIEHQITVKGEAQVNVRPDFVVLDLQVFTEGPDVARLKQETDGKAGKLLDAAAKLHIAAKDVRSSGLRIERVYTTDRNDNEVFKGYAVSRDIRITLRKIEDYELLAQALVEAGADYVESVEVGVDDESKLKNPALAAAARNAQSKALVVSEALGIKIGPPIEVGEDRLWYDKNLVQIAEGDSLGEIVVTGSRIRREDPLAFVPRDVKVEGEVWVRFRIEPAAKD